MRNERGKRAKYANAPRTFSQLSLAPGEWVSAKQWRSNANKKRAINLALRARIRILNETMKNFVYPKSWRVPLRAVCVGVGARTTDTLSRSAGNQMYKSNIAMSESVFMQISRRTCIFHCGRRLHSLLPGNAGSTFWLLVLHKNLVIASLGKNFVPWYAKFRWKSWGLMSCEINSSSNLNLF